MRRSLAARALAVLLIVTSLTLTGGDEVLAEDALMGPGTTLLVSGSAPPTEFDPDATAPTLSDDGTTVAYSAPGFGSDFRRRIEVRPILGGEPTTLGAFEWDSYAPDLDGKGQRVAYLTAYQDQVYAGGVTQADVFVGDLRSGEPSVERLTDTRGDLRFQRTLDCRPESGSSLRSADRCGPQLSSDGSTVALGVAESLTTPALRWVEEGAGDPQEPPWSATPSLMDLGSLVTSASRVLLVQNVSDRAIHFGDITVSEGADSFAVVPTGEGPPACADTDVGAGSTCSVEVRATAGAGCGPVFGRLDVDSPTPRGRSSVALVADRLCGDSSVATAAACDPHDPLTFFPGFLDDADTDSQLVDLGQVPVGDRAVRKVHALYFSSTSTHRGLEGQ